MLPIITLVGRPNVGKSTLFNCLTQTQDALVAEIPGLTRDRHYGYARIGEKTYIVVDTGGLDIAEGIQSLVTKQTDEAIEEAHHILFLVDGRAGLLPEDRTILNKLRTKNKPITLVINKSENFDLYQNTEFYELGFQKPIFISSSHRIGIDVLVDTFLPSLPLDESSTETHTGIRLTVIGRPNVGKSTLINRMLGEERVIVYDEPGTTRDSIAIPFERRGQSYILVDTAGIRRRAKINNKIESFSVIKTLQSIESSDVVLYVIDAQEGLTDQDQHLIGTVLEAGRALVLAVNKWDGLPEDQREFVRSSLERGLAFAQFAKIKFISALHGTGVGDLYPFIQEAYQSAHLSPATSYLNKLLEKAIALHQPPLVQGKTPKLRYVHLGGSKPPTLVIHGRRIASLPFSYRRYLENFYRNALKLVGTPLRIKFEESQN